MKTKRKYKIGILGFGSLIENPGNDIHELEFERVECETPFKVEYARISSSRDNAPTLVPVSDESKGKNVTAVIIILKDDTTIKYAETILWRRECHIKNTSKNLYTSKTKPSNSGTHG